MNANLRNFALWVIIVLLLLALFAAPPLAAQLGSPSTQVVPPAPGFPVEPDEQARGIASARVERPNEKVVVEIVMRNLPLWVLTVSSRLREALCSFSLRAVCKPAQSCCFG